MLRAIIDQPSSDLRGKTLLIRTDFNCPLAKGMILDATRIDKALPGLQSLLDKGVGLILLSHLGRPAGLIKEELSLDPICTYVSKAVGQSVRLIKDIEQLGTVRSGQMVMLENLRFWPEEEQNDQGFARRIANQGDIYVNDAFSCAHRAHASTHALAELLPAYAGPLLCAELAALEAAFDKPQRPVVAVVGGAKVSSKLDVLSNLVTRMDYLLLGGGMANTFLAAKGLSMGCSLMESGLVPAAKDILVKAEQAGCQILLPCDGVAGKTFAVNTPHHIVDNENLASDEMILDIGPQALRTFKTVVSQAKTLLWNGPMGAFELPPFATGTVELARFVAKKTQAGDLISIAGGGDTVAALTLSGVVDSFSYVSLAGGAFLEWIEGKSLPGIAVIDKSS